MIILSIYKAFYLTFIQIIKINLLKTNKLQLNKGDGWFKLNKKACKI